MHVPVSWTTSLLALGLSFIYPQPGHNDGTDLPYCHQLRTSQYFSKFIAVYSYMYNREIVRRGITRYSDFDATCVFLHTGIHIAVVVHVEDGDHA